MSVFAEIYTYGAIISPAAYYLFGRPLITRSEFRQALENMDNFIGTLQQARWDLDLLLQLIAMSGHSDRRRRIYRNATRLREGLNESIRLNCMEGTAMSNFWYEYDGIVSRWSLSSEKIEFGRAMFAYWLDFAGRKRDAQVRVDEVEDIWRSVGGRPVGNV